MPESRDAPAGPAPTTDISAISAERRNPAPSVLFVSGAGLHPWIWDDTRAALARTCDSAQTAVAARPAESARAGLRDYARAAIDSAPAGRFTIVAHSSGGVVAAEVAQILGARVEAVLGVCAVIPRPGGSFLTAHPAPQRWALGAAIGVFGTRPPASALRRGLTTGLERAVAERIVSEFAAESPGLYRDRVSGDAWNGATGYVVTAADREVPRRRQRAFASRLAPRWERTLDTGHLPMLEDPDGLAGAIALFLGDHTSGERSDTEPVAASSGDHPTPGAVVTRFR